jgi:hypothetical protein
MPPKAKIPAPIDRPLSRAYLREFTGWSTAYPPGLSDPTSLRRMENVLINKDGSARIRPGLRYLSYETLPVDDPFAEGVGIVETPVGTHEAFYLDNGDKAYLFAVLEDDNSVGFRVLVPKSEGSLVYALTDPEIGFDIPQTEATLNFPADDNGEQKTTYVKYLQIDNKIFALSNAGESMRLFEVGLPKVARKIISIERPNWDATDKLTVVHPNSTWITGSLLSTVFNRITDPAMTNAGAWTDGSLSAHALESTTFKSGTTSMKLEGTPTRTNLQPRPLPTGGTPVLGDWGIVTNSAGWKREVSGDTIEVNAPNAPVGSIGMAYANKSAVIKPSTKYQVSFNVTGYTKMAPRLQVLFYDSTGKYMANKSFAQDFAVGTGVKTSSVFTSPAGATYAKVLLGGKATAQGVGGQAILFRNIIFCKSTESKTFFSGDSGANYFWAGTAEKSESYYHPPVDAYIYQSPKISVTALATVYAAFEFYANQAGSTARVVINWYDAAGTFISQSAAGAATALTEDAWVRVSHSAAAPAGATRAIAIPIVYSLDRGESVFLDEGIAAYGVGALPDYFDGDGDDTTTEVYIWSGDQNNSTSEHRTYAGTQTLPPTAATPGDATLISDGTPNLNDVSFGFFYTFENQVGESAPSQATVVRVQRTWEEWLWLTPAGGATSDPNACADQLVAYMPEAVFDAAIAAEATGWNLYVFTWSDQAAVPATAIKVAHKELSSSSLYDTSGWARITPELITPEDVAPLPALTTRYNYSNPSHGGQGLVAADRMIIVKDPLAAAVIRWSSNFQGDYTNFTASRGGGYKTLTFGNLYIPAVVKLWQNPQSVDTLTILCVGTDGHSTGFYMAPAEVTSQSDATPIMGFEETTATPGTVSPYGVEVFNNALYHPLDDQLMKSTATNYNINHKSITDQIENKWVQLQQKGKIVSSQLDKRIYYVVNNPDGEQVPEGCNGNEIWVHDAGSEGGTWSRFLIPAVSLRKIEFNGQVYMSVITEQGLFYLDPEASDDEYVDRDDDDKIKSRYIPWYFETNTQGANRAHDAWCNLQQVGMSLGNFRGTMRWGIRGWDINGKAIDKNKLTRDFNDPDLLHNLPFDLEDQLLVRRQMQQWYTYAGSVLDEDDETVLHSEGQVNLLQYRYTPVSVNTGFENGSVETFEYGRASENWNMRTTDNGVPIPTNDPRRP